MLGLKLFTWQWLKIFFDTVLDRIAQFVNIKPTFVWQPLSWGKKWGVNENFVGNHKMLSGAIEWCNVAYLACLMYY